MFTHSCCYYYARFNKEGNIDMYVPLTPEVLNTC